jgi:hypothetical protein
MFPYLPPLSECLAADPEASGSIPDVARFFCVAMGLERGPLSLVSIKEELLERKVAAPV